MPGMNGPTTLEKIKRPGGFTQRLILTGHHPIDPMPDPIPGLHDRDDQIILPLNIVPTVMMILPPQVRRAVKNAVQAPTATNRPQRSWIPRKLLGAVSDIIIDINLSLYDK